MNARDEEFRQIKGYEGLYEVSNKGRVYSHISKKFMTTNTLRNGYPSVLLSKGKEEVFKFIHRLVAEAFVPNPNNYPVVNHKDENRTNNAAENLEWCTTKYNLNYGSRNKKLSESLGIPIVCIDRFGTKTRFKSARDAAKKLGILTTSICNAVKGRAKTAGGYFWKYSEI